MKRLIIISNERVSENSLGEFKSTNLDLQVLPDELDKVFNVECVFRKSKKELNHKYNIKKIFIGSSIFSFLYRVIKTIFKKNIYLIIAISPYTFLTFLLLTILRKKIYVYLMSNGYEEYEYVLGKNFKWIYGFMFKIVTKFSIVIVCHSRLFDPKKSHEITPSRLNNIWIKNCNLPNLDKPRLLYVGRINPEKGIDNFINIFNKMNTDSELFIAGNTEKLKGTDHKIKSLGYISSEQELVRTYDHCNITILPSYTEAHPYVIEESLSRKRPVIIFEDIAYVKKNKKGVYIIKRDSHEVKEQIDWILKNYQSIQKEMDKNDLPTMQKMVQQFSNILQ
tara:strand:+ start:2606 stop:3613 length:1008 start_codon:yes stop_codon:yes gene_type:complete